MISISSYFSVLSNHKAFQFTVIEESVNMKMLRHFPPKKMKDYVTKY